MKSRYQGTCMNCKERLEQQHVFQGVIICENCFKMVSHTIERTKKELHMLFLVYTDMIRAALVKGEFRPSPLPPDGRMRPSELSKALQEMGRKRDATQEAKATGDGAVRPLRREEDRPDGAVQDR